ncbi:hypothetical protein FUAX_12830 [Fulvitalea axinellae]|uniref:Uncharacterized protein n=1 Tax=Fulvitalea axinellae TaxID=1182444 RepID=A0AAU9CIV5_9BACT|nr:hypothetical protein FUAX_12830 [Fulvitalea axinellae]
MACGKWTQIRGAALRKSVRMSPKSDIGCRMLWE